MLTFLQLSFRNLAKAFGITTGIFTVIMFGMISLFVLFKEDFEPIAMSDVWMGLACCVGISAFVMILAFFTEYREYYLLHNVLSKVPFNGLHELGFQKVSLFNTRFPWKLSKVVSLAKVGAFLVVADT